MPVRTMHTRYRLSASSLILFFFAWCILHVSQQETLVVTAIVWDREFVNHTAIALDLEVLIDFNIPLDDIDSYEYIKQYSTNADDALLAKKFGKCFVVFRGTEPGSFVDGIQTSLPGFKRVCTKNNNNQNCCKTRLGFYKAYFNSYREELEQDIITCTANCTDKDNCLFLSGHSQGGNIARVAAVVLQELNPWVITTGNGQTLDRFCRQVVNATRHIRLVNTRHTSHQGLVYDFFAFWGQVDRLLYNHGKTYILTDDVTGVADLGINNGYEKVWKLDLFGNLAHNLENHPGNPPGYRSRIRNIVLNDVYPVRTNGYLSGFYCNRNVECVSRSCRKISFWLPWIKVCD